MKKKAKAIGLFSGGLDSLIAINLIQSQNIEVHVITFNIGFNSLANRLRKKYSEVSRKNTFPIQVIDISKNYVSDVILNAKYGFGKGLNPCMDCHTYMLKKAKNIMQKEKADFVFTGEVVGQRPNSQLKHQLKLVDKLSTLEGKLLRPLSAKLLPPTIPEEKGIIDRNKLESIQGRSRKRQLELAKKFNITEFQQPAGGCLLTEPIYAERLIDTLIYQKDIQPDDILLNKIGRHFRINSKSKVIVGRNEGENDLLLQAAKGKYFFQATQYQSPLTLLIGNASANSFKIAARLTLRYADGPKNKISTVLIQKGNKKILIRAKPLKQSQIEPLRVKANKKEFIKNKL